MSVYVELHVACFYTAQIKLKLQIIIIITIIRLIVILTMKVSSTQRVLCISIIRNITSQYMSLTK